MGSRKIMQKQEIYLRTRQSIPHGPKLLQLLFDLILHQLQPLGENLQLQYLLLPPPVVGHLIPSSSNGRRKTQGQRASCQLIPRLSTEQPMWTVIGVHRIAQQLLENGHSRWWLSTIIDVTNGGMMLSFLHFHHASSVPLLGPWGFAVYVDAIKLRALAICKIRVVEVIIIILDGDSDWGRGSDSREGGGRDVDIERGEITPNFSGDFKGGLLVGALEGVVLAGAELVDDVAVLLLEAPELLNELVLVEIELEFAPDLVVEGGGVVVVLGGAVGPSVLAGVVEEPLKQLDLVLALEELAGLVGWDRPASDHDLLGLLLLLRLVVVVVVVVVVGQVRIGDSGDGDGDLGVGGGGGRAIEGEGGGGGGVVVVVIGEFLIVEEILVFVEVIGGDGVIGGGHRSNLGLGSGDEGEDG
ncbi:major facilitator superfamily protein [Striga asiatica]|uniref:Major facilitator superfamily protein n=1 Tax=Striga asiatica TaxID=4170 RepID=A0A5A7PZY6_STRAF|nr:major facilitator superfamily protein [Striga asiatica]